MSICVELAPDAVDHPFATMMAQLVRQNLDDHPSKEAAARRMSGRVAIVVTDLDLAVTIACGNGRMTFHAGIAGIPDATIRAPSEWVTKMSLIELVKVGPFVFPDPRGEVAKQIADEEARGTIRTHASPSATLLLLRLTNVLAVA